MKRYLRESMEGYVKVKTLNYTQPLLLGLSNPILNLLGIKQVESKLSAIVLALLGFIAKYC
jgi:hypothetical protein